MESWVVATGAVFLYILVTIVLGVLANRAMSVDLEDFLLYGRKAGLVVLYLTVVATHHSAFAFLGSGGFFYRHGIGFWEAGTWTVLTGAIVLLDLAIPDQIFPELLVRFAPAWLTGLILAGTTTAAMSTLDSILHANMTVLTRDVYQRYIARDREQAHYVWAGRAIVLGLLIVGYVLSVRTFGFLVTLVTLSGAGALQLLPGTLGVCYPTRRPLTKAGVLAGVGVGLAVLYVTLVTVPHALGVHGAIWSIAANFVTCITVSALTRPPSPETIERIHGAVEDYVYGSGEAGLEEAPRRGF
jgi:Na+/proline symporter